MKMQSKNGRALSLIPEATATASEQIIFSVIGEDSWNFVAKLCGKAHEHFPSLCVGEKVGGRGGSVKKGSVVSLGGASSRGSVASANSRGSTASATSQDARSQSTQSRASNASIVSNSKVKTSSAASEMEAPYSCKFWRDGKYERTEEEEEEDEDDGDSEEKAFRSHGSKQGSKNGDATDVAKGVVPFTSGEGPGSMSRGSSKTSMDKTDCASTFKTRVLGHISSMFTMGRSATGSVSSSGSGSSSSANRTSRFSIRRTTVQSVDEQPGRCCVSSRYYPVETFSEELPKCLTFKQFKESCMIFLLNSQTEVPLSDIMKNCAFRKAEMDRWLKGALSKFCARAAPALFCVCLIHRPSSAVEAFDTTCPGSSLSSARSTVTPGESAQDTDRPSIASTGLQIRDPLGSMNVSYDHADVQGLQAKRCSTESTNTGLSASFASSKSLTRKSGNQPDPDDPEANFIKFNDELRTLIAAPSHDCLTYTCDFDDPQAILKVILRLSQVILDRRHEDAANARLLRAATQAGFGQRRRRCNNCRCVIS